MNNKRLLETRFMRPDGWQTGYFLNPETNHHIHYAYLMPENPRSIVIALQGLSEFTEKYHEFARDMNARGYGFWIMDWAYQGRSNRLENAPQRRYSDGFETDISDLRYFIDHHVKQASANLPLMMFGHSLGGHMGLRFLSTYPDIFKCAFFSAPFLGIYGISPLQKILFSCLKPFMPFIEKSYVFGSQDFDEKNRKSDGTDKFSSDPIRDGIHNYWCGVEPALKVGGLTFKWVNEALKSCAHINLVNIKIPVVLAMAEKDVIVDNPSIRCAASLIPNAVLIELKGAKHEIYLEKDEYRNALLNAFDKCAEDNKIVT